MGRETLALGFGLEALVRDLRLVLCFVGITGVSCATDLLMVFGLHLVFVVLVTIWRRLRRRARSNFSSFS